MGSFALARRMMVDGQIRTADVTDLRILAAFEALPREKFVPADAADLAYLDRDLPLATTPPRALLKPMVLAKMLQAAEIDADMRVLDVGCASGYSTALLARLAGTVVGVEEDANLAAQAQRLLAELGVGNATVHAGALAAGAPADAPFDVILLGGAVETVPPAFTAQLKDGGRLLCIERRGAAGKAMLYRRDGEELSSRSLFDAWATPLPGFALPPAFVF